MGDLFRLGILQRISVQVYAWFGFGMNLWNEMQLTLTLPQTKQRSGIPEECQEGHIVSNIGDMKLPYNKYILVVLLVPSKNQIGSSSEYGLTSSPST